jgi:hypothetical protein
VVKYFAQLVVPKFRILLLLERLRRRIIAFATVATLAKVRYIFFLSLPIISWLISIEIATWQLVECDEKYSDTAVSGTQCDSTNSKSSVNQQNAELSPSIPSHNNSIVNTNSNASSSTSTMHFLSPQKKPTPMIFNEKEEKIVAHGNKYNSNTNSHVSSKCGNEIGLNNAKISSDSRVQRNTYPDSKKYTIGSSNPLSSQAKFDNSSPSNITYPSLHSAHKPASPIVSDAVSSKTNSDLLKPTMKSSKKSRGAQNLTNSSNIDADVASGSLVVPSEHYLATKFIFTESNKNKESELECPICYESYVEGDITARLACFCIYHQHCIENWWRRIKYKNLNCPIHLLDAPSFGV